MPASCRKRLTRAVLGRRSGSGHCATPLQASRDRPGASARARRDGTSAALTGTPLAAARRRRFTFMSEGPIMSTFGIVLMLVGAALAAAEAHVPSHGALGGAAAVAVAAGIALVVAGAGVSTAVALIVGLAAGMVAAGYAWIVVRKGLAASRHRVRSGSGVSWAASARCAPRPPRWARCSLTGRSGVRGVG